MFGLKCITVLVGIVCSIVRGQMIVDPVMGQESTASLCMLCVSISVCTQHKTRLPLPTSTQTQRQQRRTLKLSPPGELIPPRLRTHVLISEETVSYSMHLLYRLCVTLCVTVSVMNRCLASCLPVVLGGEALLTYQTEHCAQVPHTYNHTQTPTRSHTHTHT